MTSDDQGQERGAAETFFGDADRMTGYNRAWFNLIRVHRKLYPRITKALKSEGIRDPIWYEILLHLEQAGPEGQPMSALEDILFVPQYALSRHVSRLHDEGYVQRRTLADGRRLVLSLTDKGRGLHDRIWSSYVAAMQAELAPHLSIEEAYDLAFLMTRLLQREGETAAP